MEDDLPHSDHNFTELSSLSSPGRLISDLCARFFSNAVQAACFCFHMASHKLIFVGLQCLPFHSQH